MTSVEASLVAFVLGYLHTLNAVAWWQVPIPFDRAVLLALAVGLLFEVVWLASWLPNRVSLRLDEEVAG